MESVVSPDRSYRWELLLNQVWQGLNFFSKAGFLALLAPLMLKVWGPVGYGMFALASSLLVSLAVLDCGVRSLTRLRLCEARTAHDTKDFNFAICEGLSAFALIAFLAFAVSASLAVAHLWSHWLQLPPEGDFLIAMTVGLIGLFMLSLLLLEPLAAEGRISALKAANTAGATVAIPMVGLWVWFGGSVTAAVFLYFLCLILPNLILFFTGGLLRTKFWHEWPRLTLRHILGTLHSGGWFYATTIAYVAKTHALTFLVSAVGGPAAAGIFYILLRITEIVGGLGATSSETSQASLANETTAAGRGKNFLRSYTYTLIFCLHGVLIIGFLTRMLLEHWLPKQAATLPPGITWAMALYGLGVAFSKTVVNAAMGTGLVRQAAIGNLIEAALVLACGLALQPLFGLTGLFMGSGLASLALLPTAFHLSKNFAQHFSETWLQPVALQVLPLLISGTALGAAWFFHSVILAMATMGLVGLLAIASIRRSHAMG
jgi:O-antigen/teichoic acid export membrane protein